MRLMLTASADEAVPPSAWTFNEIGRLSSVIEARNESAHLGAALDPRADLSRLVGVGLVIQTTIGDLAKFVLFSGRHRPC